MIKTEFGVDEEEGEFSVFQESRKPANSHRMSRALSLLTVAKLAGWATKHSSESSRLTGTMFR